MSLSRDGKPALLVSPNSILANALLRSIDLLRPRVLAARPKRIEFVVGTQINGAPHLGTNLVQSAAFLLAKIARREFSIDTIVRFGALDNAPHTVDLDPETHHAYQKTYFHALGKDQIGELIEGYYQAFFRSLSEATDTEYAVETYTDQQATPGFRAEFLRTLERLEGPVARGGAHPGAVPGLRVGRETRRPHQARPPRRGRRHLHRRLHGPRRLRGAHRPGGRRAVSGSRDAVPKPGQGKGVRSGPRRAARDAQGR
jgi:hypothetical protein